MGRSGIVRAGVGLFLWAALAAAAVAGDAPPPPPPGAPPAAELARTDVVLHTKVPLRPGRNAIWCATIQLAWESLANTIAPGQPLRLGPPAPPDAVAEMNRRSFPHGDLDEASFVAIGGFAGDGVAERIRKAVAEKWPRAMPPTLWLSPRDAVGYARLKKDLPFETSFRVHPAPMAFGEGRTPVQAFGSVAYDAAPDAKRMAKQVVLHLSKSEEEPHGEWRGVVELLPKDPADRILLSSLPAADSLEGALLAVAARLAEGRAVALENPAEVYVPRVRLDTTHRFTSLLGAPIVGIPFSFVRDVTQAIAFSLTERGAALESEAKIECYCGLEPVIHFDGPFLLALMRRGASRPYLLAWIANDELLEAYEMPLVDAKGVAPFAGKWTIDADASLAEAVEYAAKEAKPTETPEQARAKARERLAPEFEGNHGSVEVAPDGRVTLKFDPAYDTSVMVGALRRFGTRTVFVAETADGAPARQADCVPVDMAVAGGRLRMGLPGEPATVYRRP